MHEMSTLIETTETDELAALQARIADTKRTHASDPKACWRAMRAIKWRMYCPELGLWAALRGLDIVAVPSEAEALVFDGRDNELTKLRFYRASTGINWQVRCAS